MNNNDNKKRESVTYTDYNIFPGKIRLVGEGKTPIIIDRDEAIEMAKSKNMNLVQIAYNKNDKPKSICKIMNFSKFKYEQKKKEKEAKKKQKENIFEIKEIRFSIRIDDGDKITKLKKIKELLSDGAKVKLTIKLLRGEMHMINYAKEVMLSILKELDGIAELDQNPSFIGNMLSCTIKKK